MQIHLSPHGALKAVKFFSTLEKVLFRSGGPARMSFNATIVGFESYRGITVQYFSNFLIWKATYFLDIVGPNWVTTNLYENLHFLEATSKQLQVLSTRPQIV